MLKVQIKLIFIVITLFYISCDRNKKTPDTWYINASKSAVNKWASREMILPNKIKFINNPDNYNAPIELINSPLKIVASVDGKCSVCVNSLLFWNQFSNKLKSLDINCKIIMYVITDNEDEFKTIIEGFDIDNISCLFDKEAKFKNLNDLYDQRFQAALLDKDNKVILIGNPVLNETLSDLYLDTLKKLKE